MMNYHTKTKQLIFDQLLRLCEESIEAARKAINAGLTLEPNNREMLLLQIRIISGQGNYYYAKTLTEQFLEKHVQSYQVQHEQLKILLAQQEWSTALQLIEKLRQDGKLQLEDQLIHVQILTRQSQLTQAQALLENLLKQLGLWAGRRRENRHCSPPRSIFAGQRFYALIYADQDIRGQTDLRVGELRIKRVNSVVLR